MPNLGALDLYKPPLSPVFPMSEQDGPHVHERSPFPTIPPFGVLWRPAGLASDQRSMSCVLRVARRIGDAVGNFKVDDVCLESRRPFYVARGGCGEGVMY